MSDNGLDSPRFDDPYSFAYVANEPLFLFDVSESRRKHLEELFPESIAYRSKEIWYSKNEDRFMSRWLSLNESAFFRRTLRTLPETPTRPDQEATYLLIKSAERYSKGNATFEETHIFEYLQTIRHSLKRKIGKDFGLLETIKEKQAAFDWISSQCD